MVFRGRRPRPREPRIQETPKPRENLQRSRMRQTRSCDDHSIPVVENILGGMVMLGGMILFLVIARLNRGVLSVRERTPSDHRGCSSGERFHVIDPRPRIVPEIVPITIEGRLPQTPWGNGPMP